VFDALVCGVGIVADAGADTRNPVRGHRRADAAAAQDDAAVRAALAQRRADRRGVVGVVNRGAAVRPDVEHVRSVREERLEAFLQLEAGVIRSDSDSHLNSPVPSAAARQRRCAPA
jgi:hypothetical protein